MVKRQLTDEEKNLCNRNIEFIKKEIEYGKAMIEYYDLQINKLLDLNIERKKAEFGDIQRQLKQQLELGLKTIEITQDQVDNGVEIKDENKSDETKEVSE